MGNYPCKKSSSKKSNIVKNIKILKNKKFVFK